MQDAAKRDGSLVFLKFGGSLITDKQRPRAPRPEVLERLAGEIGRALKKRRDIRLVLGNGAGSFGHVPPRNTAPGRACTRRRSGRASPRSGARQPP